MPGPSLKKEVKSTLLGVVASVFGALGDSTVEHAAASESAYTFLESLMKQINLDNTLSLKEKKVNFLSQAKEKINQLTTNDLLRLYAAYKSDIETGNKKYEFIYAEDTTKSIGWIKHTIFRSKDPTGNTNTHKQFLGLLKTRALANIERHNQDAKRNFLGLNEQEFNNLKDLMSETRGRVPNMFSKLGAGLEGEFSAWKKVAP